MHLLEELFSDTSMMYDVEENMLKQTIAFPCEKTVCLIEWHVKL